VRGFANIIARLNLALTLAAVNFMHEVGLHPFHTSTQRVSHAKFLVTRLLKRPTDIVSGGSDLNNIVDSVTPKEVPCLV